jgi:hypothetical protein
MLPLNSSLTHLPGYPINEALMENTKEEEEFNIVL